jgi:hypothetical protein
MIPSDIETGGRDSRPPTADGTPVQSEEGYNGDEEHSEDERLVRSIVEEEQQPNRRVMGGFLPQQMARVELMDPSWLGHEEPLLLEHTPIPRPQLSPQARRRNRSRAKYGK